MQNKEYKWGATVPVWNRDLWIGPYLEMLLDFGIEPVVVVGDEPWASQSGDEVLKADKTNKVLDTYFPDIPVVRGIFHHHRDSLNAGIKKLPLSDIVLTLDCDVFLTREDWEGLLKFTKDNYEGNDTFAMNHETMIREYYYDWRYGQPALLGGVPPIFAAKRGVNMLSMTLSDGKSGIVLDEPSKIRFHHFRFCKASGSGKGRCVEPSPDNMDKFNGDTFEPAPQEIVDRLTKWQDRVKHL